VCSMCENCINSPVVADLPYECWWFACAWLGSVLHECPCIPKYIMMPSVRQTSIETPRVKLMAFIMPAV